MAEQGEGKEEKQYPELDEGNLLERKIENYAYERSLDTAMGVSKFYSLNGSVTKLVYRQPDNDEYEYQSIPAYIYRISNQVTNDVAEFRERYVELKGIDPLEYSFFPMVTVLYINPETEVEMTIHLNLPAEVLPIQEDTIADVMANYMLNNIGDRLEEREVEFDLFESSGFLFSKIIGFDLSIAILTNRVRDSFSSILNFRGGFTCTLPDRLRECEDYIYNPESSYLLGNCAEQSIVRALILNGDKDKVDIAKRLCDPNMSIGDFRVLEKELGIPIMFYSVNSKPKKRKNKKGEKQDEKSNRVLLLHPSSLDVSSEYVINLLLLDGTSDKTRGTITNVNVGHYCLILDLKKVTGAKGYYCNRCCKRFQSKSKHDSHDTDKCWLQKSGKGSPEIILCETDESAEVSYEKYAAKAEKKGQTIKRGVVYYADFEALTIKTDEMRNKSVKLVQKHLPCGVCWIRDSTIPGIPFEIKYYRQINAGSKTTVKWFWDSIKVDVSQMSKWISKYNVEGKKARDFKYFERNEGKRFDESIMDIIRGYHDYHFVFSDYPVFFHNLKGYDSHPLLKDIGEYKGVKDNLSVMASTGEKYISFTLGKLKFLDSMGFLNFSLEKMVSDICKRSIEGSVKNYDELRRLFPRTIKAVNQIMKSIVKDKSYEINDTQLLLILQKGVYPYDYMDDFSKFSDLRLPDIKEFDSILTRRSISIEDYERAKQVWDAFSIRTMGEYHDLYNVQDVGLLADCFDMYRTFMKNMHDLDPADEYTTPGISWKGMLKCTGSVFHAFKQDQLDMHIATEKGTRGGVSIVPGRELIANNKYMGKAYDKSKPSTYLFYTDATNLYGCGMTQLLPTGDYEYIRGKTKRKNAMNLILSREYGEFDGKYRDNCDGKITSDEPSKDIVHPDGHVFMIDANIPSTLHDYFWDFPICPRKESVPYGKLSPYSRKRLEELKLKNGESKKLLVTLEKLEKYVIHERNLKLYISLGLEVTHIHKVLRFSQAPAMRKYILKNSRERANHDNEFIRELLKLLNNAVFGKTMENKRKRIAHKLTTDPEEFQKHISNPRMKNWVIYSETTIGVNFTPAEVVLDKPVIVGFSILEISKCLIYNFYYNILKRKYPKPGQLILGFSDTDSLMVQVETEDLWQDISDTDYLLNALSTYTLPKSNPAYRDGVKTPGKMEVQNGLCNIDHFKGLQAKFYAYKMTPYSTLSESELKKVPKKLVKMCGKGISNSFLSQEAKFEHYLVDTPILVDQVRISHSMHELGTTTYKKKAFNPIDNKFYQINGRHTIPYGHWRIAEYENALSNGETNEQALRFLDRNYGTYESIVLPQIEELARKGTKALALLTSFNTTLKSGKRKPSSKSSIKKSKKLKA